MSSSSFAPLAQHAIVYPFSVHFQWNKSLFPFPSVALSLFERFSEDKKREVTDGQMDADPGAHPMFCRLNRWRRRRRTTSSSSMLRILGFWEI